MGVVPHPPRRDAVYNELASLLHGINHAESLITILKATLARDFAILFDRLTDSQRAAHLKWAHSLTNSNCSWTVYLIGQLILVARLKEEK
mgnify:FL=1